MVEHVAGPYLFEPHGGFGSLDPDGDPWPFGYISETAPNGVPSPIFELDVVIGRPVEQYEATARLLVAAPVLKAALERIARHSPLDADRMIAREALALIDGSDGQR